MRIKLPNPAIVLASIALLVSLSGTAIAAGAVPLAKKALFANNAGKLQGKTAAQVAAIEGPATTLDGKSADEIAAMPGPATTLNGKSADEIAAMPGPASSAASLVSTATAPFSLGAQGEGDFAVSCPAGSKPVSGGYTYSGNAAVLSLDTRPTSDTTWTIYLMNISNTGASGNVIATCVK
jgi:hypothetical protein